MNLHHLHSVILIAALVGIFLALQRNDRSPRVRFWVAGWIVMLLHFILRVLTPATPGFVGTLCIAADDASLMVAGIAFLISVTDVCDRPRVCLGLLVALGMPAAVFAALVAWSVTRPWLAMICVAALVIAGAAFFLRRRGQVALSAVAAATGIVATGTVAMYRVWTVNLESGFLVVLAGLYALTAALFWRHYRRLSPGVLTTTAGFSLWATQWALAAFIQNIDRIVAFDNDLWNVPKLLVAFGLIVVLLEDESLAVHDAGERARQAGVQIQRFADVTSRLLGGVEVRSLCGHIAEVITQSTTFERVVITLVDDQRRLEIAGYAGVSELALQQIEDSIRNVTVDAVEQLCSAGRRVAANSFIWKSEPGRSSTVRTTKNYEPNPYWNIGDELLVPLRSPRGAIVGAISLDDPRDVARVTAEEMSKIEILAADLAVAIENALLHRQLVVSEKLAAIGQLVAGVAHELNNPLTAVMGYSEVLRERTADEGIRRELGIINREAVRMKHVIENLLRFSQQDRSERKRVDLLPLIEDVVHLRAYEARNRGAQVVTRVPATLPAIAGDESRLKQAFLNVLTNALDAVEQAPEKHIVIDGRVQGDRVLLTFTDSGAGFSHPDRVFDPFFTTKSIGKGTGLGLSICYGILKEHGGDIYAYNVHPAGACIAMELPIAEKQRAAKAAEAGATHLT